MSEGIYDFLLHKYFVAATAVLTFGQSCFRASRFYRCIRYFFMSERIYDFLFYKYFVATRTVFAFG